MASLVPSPSPARPLPAPPPRKDEAERRAELIAMKRVANGLLASALLVFVVARILEHSYPWMGFVRATAEASVVGGLADWFAVTALFRKPLGLPIPHTAIIPTQKDRIGKILGGFVQNHFLSRDVLTARLKSMRLAERGAEWLSHPDNGAALARHAAVGLARAVQSLPEGDISDLIRQNAVARLQSVQLAPLLGRLLSVVATDDRHQVLLDEALALVASGLEKNQEGLRQKIREESPWWVPAPMDAAFHRRLLAAITRLVDEVRADPHHPLRLKFDTAFRGFVDRLETSPEVIRRAEALKVDLLESPAVEEFAASLWGKARQAAARYSPEADSATLEPLARGISAAGDSLLADRERLDELDGQIIGFVAAQLEHHRHEVAELIAETVRAWDPRVAADRIELAVGRDLQFIRLNGTLVGGLAGLVIYTVVYLLR
ncbi:MAG TPA: DUF445 family protein [Gemmatimonadales bacterium]|nr:DUF445 family protein [Gemmatimonadales bacterium]